MTQEKRVKIFIIIFNIISALLFIPACMYAIMWPMAFDSPGSQESIMNWIFVYGLIFQPFLIIVSLIVPWLLYENKYYKIAVISATAPLLLRMLTHVFVWF